MSRSDKLLQIVNREGSNFVLFLNRTAVLMDQSESGAQPTPCTSSGTDSVTIPPVLTEQDNPGAALNVLGSPYTLKTCLFCQLAAHRAFTRSTRDFPGCVP